MSKITILLISFIISLPVVSQTLTEDKYEKFDKVFTKVEQPAEFPGGLKGYQNYMARNLNFVSLEPVLKKGAQTAVLKFIVDSTGSVSNVSVVNEKLVHPEVAKEAARFIRRGPKWKPAKQNGITVNYQVVLPINFPAAE